MRELEFRLVKKLGWWVKWPVQFVILACLWQCIKTSGHVWLATGFVVMLMMASYLNGRFDEEIYQRTTMRDAREG